MIILFSNSLLPSLHSRLLFPLLLSTERRSVLLVYDPSNTPYKLSTAIIYVNGIMYWVCVLESAPSPLIPRPHVPCYKAKTISWCSMPYTTAEVGPLFQRKSTLDSTEIFTFCLFVLALRIFLFGKLLCSALVLTEQRHVTGLHVSSRRASGWMDSDLVNIAFYIYHIL